VCHAFLFDSESFSLFTFSPKQVPFYHIKVTKLLTEWHRFYDDCHVSQGMMETGPLF
jgi:hypothetical protein